jgi:hypothetical protein
MEAHGIQVSLELLFMVDAGFSRALMFLFAAKY